MTTMVTPDRTAGRSLTAENQSINIAASLEGEFLGGIYNCTPQSINQCINQSINHPVHQSIDELIARRKEFWGWIDDWIQQPIFWRLT